MMIRFRQSVKILPGVRINFNKNSTSLSLGTRGAHYTMSSTGRRTFSAGIPGTGIYAYETVNPRTPKRQSAKSVDTPPDLESFAQPTPKPSLFASRAEKAFSAFLNDIYDPNNKYSSKEVIEKAKALREQYDSLVYPLNVLSPLYIINDEEYEDKILEMGRKIWAAREVIFLVLLLSGLQKSEAFGYRFMVNFNTKVQVPLYFIIFAIAYFLDQRKK
jgi:Protein of unknown function (DUF4236)